MRVSEIPRLPYDVVDEWIDDRILFTETTRTEEGDKFIYFHAKPRGKIPKGSQGRMIIQLTSDTPPAEEDEDGYIHWPFSGPKSFDWQAEPLTDKEIDAKLRIGSFRTLDFTA